MTSRTRRQRGFTLIELVVSLSITAVLMTGIASALVIASRAIPDPQSNPWTAAPHAILALDTVLADLMVAQTVSEKTATAVTFTVADRGNNAAPETVRYAWSGTAGDPLTRRLNNGTITNLLDSADSFTLVYSLATTTETVNSPTTTAPEGVVANFNGWGVTPTSFGLSAGAWAGSLFLPVPPAGATQLQITRAKMKLSRGTTDPAALVTASIHRWTSGAPGSAIGSPVSVQASSLPSPAAWVEFAFADVTLTSPVAGDEYVVVMAGNLPNSADIQHEYLQNQPKDSTRFVWTTNAGGAWNPQSKKNDYDAPVFVYGIYTTNAASQTTVTRYYLKRVEVSLNTHAGNESEFVAGTPVLNMPEVSGP